MKKQCVRLRLVHILAPVQGLQRPGSSSRKHARCVDGGEMPPRTADKWSSHGGGADAVEMKALMR